MSAYQLFRKLFPYYLIAIAVFVISTIIALVSDWSFLGLDFIWYRFDLRRECNVAVWFSSVSMLYCGLTFLIVGLHRDVHFLNYRSKLFFVSIGILSFLLSADETGQLHEAMGEKLSESLTFLSGTALGNAGYSWVIIFSPLVILAGIWTISTIKDMFKTLSDSSRIIHIVKNYAAAFACILLVLLLEVIQSVLFSMPHTAWEFILPSIEETAELCIMAFFTYGNFVVIEEFTGYEKL